jgi:hypothetical protein
MISSDAIDHERLSATDCFLVSERGPSPLPKL